MRDRPDHRFLSFSMLRAGLSQAFSGSGSQKELFSCLVIMVCALVLLVHLPALSAKAIMYDDRLYVTENRLVQRPSLESMRAFFVEVWRPSTVPGYYHPLAMVSLMVDRFLAGPYGNLRTYHRTSLALHVANTALLAIFLYLLFPQPFVVAAAALLFGLHPITVDSVCWMSERKTVLSSFFALWSLVAYVKFTREGERRFYAACVVTYALALLSKPIALPLPLAMLLMDYWPLDRFRWRCVTEKLPLFAVTGVFAVIGYVSQLRASHILLPGQYDALQVPLVLSHNIVFYTCKILWPTNLSPHYEPPEYLSLFNVPMILSIVGTCVLILLVTFSVRWTRAIFMSCLIASVMLFPAGGIVSHTIVIAANRYLYLPVIGLLLLLAWALTKLIVIGQEHRLRWCSLAASLAVIGLASAEGIGTRRYLCHWSDTRSLYEYMLSMFPESGVLHNDLAIAAMAQGRREEALEHCRSSLRANPASYRPHYNLALVLDELGGHDRETVRHYRRAVQIKPSFADGNMNLGLLLLRMGNVCEGLASLRNATEVGADNPTAHFNLGRMLVLAGQPQEGIAHLREAVAINPRFIRAQGELAWFLATHPDSRVRDPNAAVEAAEQAQKMTRDRDARVLDTLAAAHAAGGQYRKAVETARKAMAVATRLGATQLAQQIEDRIRLYENECPYYEDPRVQLDRMMAESKKKEATADSNPRLTTDNRELRTDVQRLEVQDEAEAISAE